MNANCYNTIYSKSLVTADASGIDPGVRIPRCRWRSPPCPTTTSIAAAMTPSTHPGRIACPAPTCRRSPSIALSPRPVLRSRRRQKPHQRRHRRTASPLPTTVRRSETVCGRPSMSENGLPGAPGASEPESARHAGGFLALHIGLSPRSRKNSSRAGLGANHPVGFLMFAAHPSIEATGTADVEIEREHM
jgi:hypothetical protein